MGLKFEVKRTATCYHSCLDVFGGGQEKASTAARTLQRYSSFCTHWKPSHETPTTLWHLLSPCYAEAVVNGSTGSASLHSSARVVPDGSVVCPSL